MIWKQHRLSRCWQMTFQGVENVQDELRKLEEEKNKEQEDFGVYKNFTKAFQGAADRTEAVTDEPEGT